MKRACLPFFFFSPSLRLLQIIFVCSLEKKLLTNFLTSALFIRKLIMCTLCRNVSLPWPWLQRARVQWSLNWFVFWGKKELLEYWICRLSSVLPERASSAVVLEEELPVISTSTEPLFCFVLFLYVAVKLIAGSHLFIIFFNLELIRRKQLKGNLPFNSFLSRTLSAESSPKVPRCESAVVA